MHAALLSHFEGCKIFEQDTQKPANLGVSKLSKLFIFMKTAARPTRPCLACTCRRNDEMLRSTLCTTASSA